MSRCLPTRLGARGRPLLGWGPLLGGALGALLGLLHSDALAQERPGTGAGLRNTAGPGSGEAGRGAPPRGKAAPPGWARPANDNSPEAQLGRAKLAYQRGDYGAAVLLLRPLLYPQALLAQEDQVLLAHKLLALSYFFEHDEQGAEQELNLLLSLKPDFALDPVVDPIKAVAFLDDIRRRTEQRLQEIRRRQAEEEQRVKAEIEALQKQAEVLAQKQAKRIYIERVVTKQFSAVSLLPLGIPQLQSRRRGMGAVLLTGELLTGGASLATWLTVRLRYPDNTFPPRELNAAQALTGTYLTTGVVFWGLVLTGLIDALLHARTVTEVHELRAPPKDMPGREKEPASKEKDPPPGGEGPAPPPPHITLQPLGALPGGLALDPPSGLHLPTLPSYGLQVSASF